MRQTYNCDECEHRKFLEASLPPIEIDLSDGVTLTINCSNYKSLERLYREGH